MTVKDAYRSKRAEIARIATKQIHKNELPAFTKFIDAFYPAASPEDLMARKPEHLFAIVLQAWHLAEISPADGPRIHMLPAHGEQLGGPNPATGIFLLNRDMPFLVDSITGGLSITLGLRMEMMHHPIITVARDKDGERLLNGDGEGHLESLMYIEVEPQSDTQILADVKDTLLSILADVRKAVEDWRPMLAKLEDTVSQLTANPPALKEEQVDETVAFLRWLAQDHYTFLGFREYRFEKQGGDLDVQQVEGSGLGILREADRYVLRDKHGLTPVSPEIRNFLKEGDPLFITKANVKSTVHRVSHLDYVGVKMFDKDGKAIGERRFIGLFTSLSYSEFSHDVPVLRRKVEQVQSRALFDRKSYAGKALAHILETFPRDELFQVSEDWLYETAMGVLQLTERPRPRAFLRPDKFERFVSALIYVPRDVYNSNLRQEVGRILCEAYNGEVSVYYASLSEHALARWHFIIRTRPGEVRSPTTEDINAQIAEAALGWEDRLHAELVDRHGEEKGNRLHHIYRRHFTLSYREAFTPGQAAADIMKIEDMIHSGEMSVDFYRHHTDPQSRFRLKIFNQCKLVPLSNCMPILEHLGFRCLVEHTYVLRGKEPLFVHDFTLERTQPIAGEFQDYKARIEALFLNVTRGRVENDGFNELVLAAGLDWRQIIVLRAYGKYLRQLGLSFSLEHMAATIVKHAEVGGQLFALFDAQFNPAITKMRDNAAISIITPLMRLLESVSSLDEDRILRGFLHALRATLRTNFYQEGILEGNGEAALAFKIRSGDIEEAPLPRPHVEIWVYSPQLEGVHLRGGPIARGGLRWSDRAEDFRTEILGLVKAQQVKNSVIVPQGSKGGFYPKRLPSASNREAFMAEGVASYRAFISSLLSLTDNLKGGAVVPPENTIRRDGDDPYLVVAADKGTATFSDIANEISDGHEFWLSDAFASGGKNGYDHKKMGITARGAWVCVRRHFREMGLNTQSDPISVIGVGDMSGDVFGNGMLLSETIELKAAFNHLHIFLDPNPQSLSASHKERKRLFNMPRSSWEDYDPELISEGGGVFSRAAKTIKLSAPVREWLGIEEDQLAPNELINAILRAEADLLWFGGIGTYVRASSESNAQVGDRANDSVRVTAPQLRVKVVGEGGNLGMTQQARIEFARRGGRLNTDFIDNSAGVDCSDKEVNIKILLADAIEKDKLDRDERDALLEQMTNEVAEIVLSDNYLQTQAISLAEAQAVDARPYQLGLIRALERDGGLNREIEYLPTDEGFAEMAANDQGLTRPELATLMAYAKMSLSEILLRGKLIDDPVLQPELQWGFPTVLRERFADELQTHQLRRDIIATVLANEVVNWGGLTFVYQIKEETGLAVEDIVAAFVVVREIYGLQKRWQQINALDYMVDASVQYDMHQSVSDSVRDQVLWMLRNLQQPFDVSKLVTRFKDPFKALFDIEVGVLSSEVREKYLRRRDGMVGAGVDLELATFVASFEVFRQGADVIWVSEETGRSVPDVAKIYFTLGDVLGHDWIRAQAARIPTDDHWDKLSIRSELEELDDQQRQLVHDVSAMGDGQTPDALLDHWRSEEMTKIIRVDRLLEDLTASGALTVSKLSFATRHLRSIMR